MEKSRHPNVIRTWVVNRTQAHGRLQQPARLPHKNQPNVTGTFHPRGAPNPSHKGNS
jgi:hypothetical protein